MFFDRIKRRIQRVLVVEDEALVAFDNEHFLTQAGYVVAGTVDTLAHAQPIILAGDLDLVIADVNLSGVPAGIEVARLANERGIAVLFVTGACPADARHLALGCLAKPYSQRDLLTAIDILDASLDGRRVPRAPRGLTLFPAPTGDEAPS